jgi:hypothetical protein
MAYTTSDRARASVNPRFIRENASSIGLLANLARDSVERIREAAPIVPASRELEAS